MAVADFPIISAVSRSTWPAPSSSGVTLSMTTLRKPAGVVSRLGWSDVDGIGASAFAARRGLVAVEAAVVRVAVRVRVERSRSGAVIPSGYHHERLAVFSL